MKWRHYCIHIFGMEITISGLIKEIGILIFIITSAFVMPTSAITSLILAGCASILAALKYYGSIGKRIKIVFRAIAPVTIAVIVIYCLIHFLGDAKSQQFINLILRIAAVVLIIPIIFERTYFDRHYSATYDLLKDYKLSLRQRMLYRFLKFAYRILILFGFVLTICFAEKFFACSTVAGCILWVVYSFVADYYVRTCDIRDTSNEQIVDTDSQEQLSGGYTDKTISESEVDRIVQKIADRWSYRGDTFLMLATGSIKYSVNVEVIGGNIINYTVNGKLSGVREEDLSAALTFSESKISNVACKISEETKNELAKHNLPYSSYEVNVNKGYIG